MKQVLSYLLIAILAVVLGIGAQRAAAQVYVHPYTRSDGTVVQGHMRSAPDGNPYNNYSFPGNTNPYTGKIAPGNPDTYLGNYNGGGGTSGTYPGWGNSRSR